MDDSGVGHEGHQGLAALRGRRKMVTYKLATDKALHQKCGKATQSKRSILSGANSASTKKLARSVGRFMWKFCAQSTKVNFSSNGDGGLSAFKPGLDIWCQHCCWDTALLTRSSVCGEPRWASSAQAGGFDAPNSASESFPAEFCQQGRLVGGLEHGFYDFPY